MARHCYQGTFKDGQGQVVGPETTANSTAGEIYVYLAGGTTAADVYVAESGGSAVDHVDSDDDGHFLFWVDDSEYKPGQRFKITLSHADFEDKSYDDLVILPESNIQNVITYGATGDGSTDDTTNINTAIAALTAGDTLFFPAGTYIVSSALTDIPSNTSVLGAGRNTSIIKIKDSAVAGTGTAFTVMGTADSGTNLIFSDFTIDGNQDNQSWVWNKNANYLLSIRATNVLVRNCEFKENVANGTGVPTNGSEVIFDSVWSHDHGKKPFYFGEDVANVKVVNCFAYNSTNDSGIGISQGSYRLQIIGNHCYGNGTAGIRVGVSAGEATTKDTRDVVVMGNDCYGNVTGIVYGDAAETTGGSLYRDSLFVGNLIHDNTGDGFYSAYVGAGIVANNQITSNGRSGMHLINSRNLQILGNNIANNNQDDASYDGIFIVDTSADANADSLGNYIIANNYIGDYQDTPTQDYGIDGNLNYEGFSDIMLLKNNIFEGNVSGEIDGHEQTAKNYTGVTVTIKAGLPASFDTTNNAIAATLGSGTFIGQQQLLVLETDGGNDATLTVTNHETSDPGVFTFADVDDALVLMWTGTEWITIANSGVDT